jgi:hypothetical protein
MNSTSADRLDVCEFYVLKEEVPLENTWTFLDIPSSVRVYPNIKTFRWDRK